MFKVSWYKFLKDNLYLELQKVKRTQWLTVLFSMIRSMWTEFENYRLRQLYRINHNGQVIYMQKALNDIFDPLGRNIEVVDGDWANKIYIYQEGAPDPLWIYWPWDVTTAYVAGNEVQDEGYVYECMVDNIGSQPKTTPAWLKTGTVPFIFHPEDLGDNDFYVLVPAGLPFDEVRMTAEINFYRIAGKTFKILFK